MTELFLKINFILLILAIVYSLLKHLKIIQPHIIDKINDKIYMLIINIFSSIKNFFKKIYSKIKSLIKKKPK